MITTNDHLLTCQQILFALGEQNFAGMATLKQIRYKQIKLGVVTHTVNKESQSEG